MKKSATHSITFTHTLLYHILPLLTIFLILIPLLFPYFKEGYFPTHDGEWAVVRLGDMYREVKDGQFPARFSGNLNFGYGYPLFNYAYPLPYYLGVGLLLITFGLVSSIETLFVLSVIFSVVGMYYLSSLVWKSRLAGVVSAVLYAYFPFRMVDLYVRGSLGDTLASAFFPYILLCLYFIHTKEKKLLPSILAGLGFGFLVLAHNIMAVLYLMVLVPLIGLFIYEKRQNWRWYVGSISYGLLFSAFFWLPALAEKHFIALSQTPIADRNLYFVSIQQLLFSPWGYAPPTETNGFTYQVGWPHLIVLLTAGFFCIKGLKTDSYLVKRIAAVLVFLSLIFIILMQRITGFVWHMPILSEINYPWTLLLPLGFVVSFLAGYLLEQKVWIRSFVILCAILAIILYLPWAKPSEYVNRGDGFYLTKDATTTSSDELMPLWVKEKAKTRGEKITTSLVQGNVDLLENTSKSLTAMAQLKEKSTVIINTIYFPGWSATVDGVATPIRFDNPQGVMHIAVDKGTHRIEAHFKNTPIRNFANTLSITSLVLLPLLFILSKRMKGFS